MPPTVTLILLMVILLVLVFVIPVIRIRSAIKAVIGIFRKNNATSIENARTQEELRLNPKPLWERLFTIRDFKPQALRMLIDSKVVQVTEEGKLYLSEESLAASGLDRFINRH